MTYLIATGMVWIIVLPLLSGILTFLAEERIRPLIGLAMSCLLSGITVAVAFASFLEGPVIYDMGGWDRPLGIGIRLDGLSASMLILTATVGLCVSIFASAYFTARHATKMDNQHDQTHGTYFWPIWLFTWSGLNALFLAADIFNIYVCLELMSLGAIALVAIEGTANAMSAAIRYLFLSLLASLLYLTSVGFLYSVYGTLDLIALQHLLQQGPVSAVAISLITLSLVIKSALFPLHFWLPPAHANAPAPVSAVLSGVVITAAFYLLIRFWFSAFISIVTPAASQVLGILGVIALSYGGLQALRQSRLKMIVAYSTVAQIGYMFLLFPLATQPSPGQIYAWTGSIYFAISHALAKAAAFLFAGAVMWYLGHDRLDGMRGLARRFPLGTFIFAMAGLSLSGMPPSGGFVAKWMLLKAAMLSGQWYYAVVMIAGSLIAAMYIVRVLEVAMREPEGEDIQPIVIPRRMQYAPLVLSAMAIAMGLIASFPLDVLREQAPLWFTKTAEGIGS